MGDRAESGTEPERAEAARVEREERMIYLLERIAKEQEYVRRTLDVVVVSVAIYFLLRLFG